AGGTGVSGVLAAKETTFTTRHRDREKNKKRPFSVSLCLFVKRFSLARTPLPQSFGLAAQSGSVGAQRGDDCAQAFPLPRLRRDLRQCGREEPRHIVAGGIRRFAAFQRRLHGEQFELPPR